MKDGTLYAGRLKKAYPKWKHAAGDVEVPEEPDDPIRRLALSVFGLSGSEAQAERAIDRLLANVADWNELRVSLPAELCRALGDSISDGVGACQRLAQALQSIYEREHKISLERLKNLGRREARQFLETLKGVDEYAAAGIMLWSMGGHAIPVNDQQLHALKDAQLVHPTATRGEVQAFLERHIAADDAKRFCMVLRAVASKRGLDMRTGKPTKKKSAAH